MGLGDDIMATAHARKVFTQTGRRVRFVRKDGRIWQASGGLMWMGNPHIEPVNQRDDNAIEVMNCPGARPYIKEDTKERFIWQTWDKAPGDIYLNTREKIYGSRYAGKVVISPLRKQKPVRIKTGDGFTGLNLPN